MSSTLLFLDLMEADVLKKTTKGYYIFDPLRPFPKKMVFKSEASLKQAKIRYYAVVGFLFYFLIRLQVYLRTDAPRPDWLYPEGMIATLLSPLVILPFVYLIMPEKEFYDPAVHGEFVED
jgi:hypothetical protein